MKKTWFSQRSLAEELYHFVSYRLVFGEPRPKRKKENGNDTQKNHNSNNNNKIGLGTTVMGFKSISASTSMGLCSWSPILRPPPPATLCLFFSSSSSNCVTAKVCEWNTNKKEASTHTHTLLSTAVFHTHQSKSFYVFLIHFFLLLSHPSPPPARYVLIFFYLSSLSLSSLVGIHTPVLCMCESVSDILDTF